MENSRRLLLAHDFVTLSPDESEYRFKIQCSVTEVRALFREDNDRYIADRLRFEDVVDGEAILTYSTPEDDAQRALAFAQALQEAVSDGGIQDSIYPEEKDASGDESD